MEIRMKEYDGECPCEDCSQAEYCDSWEARFCCTYCHWLGCGHCDDCDSMYI